ncbi:hypothetical protein EJ08DRAFT_439590 [Tothia fuscella]|uniref:Uncharacterized protein n=1 Tax=Tothia fuscella TaxID=1048955 RepID=A0A9P4TVB2_9PEZI|nr:hypothetical protein EJ08DRAFT_439590 [Tothia fuscella]
MPTMILQHHAYIYTNKTPGNASIIFTLYVHPYETSTTPHPIYSITTTAPNPFSVSTIFSASSFGTPSFIILGALSTNFLLSTNDSPNMLFTSLMTFGLDVVSNDCSFRLKRVFSWTTGAGSSSSTGAAAGAAAPAPGPADMNS